MASGEGVSAHHSLRPDCKTLEDGIESTWQEIPRLPLEGDRKEWLLEIRNFLGATDVTLATLHLLEKADFRNPYSTLDGSEAINQRIRLILGVVDTEAFSELGSSQWIDDSPLDQKIYFHVIPAAEEGKATLIILEFDDLPELPAPIDFLTMLLAQESRLELETRRRISAEEMFFHSQKLNCLGQLAGGVAHDFNNLLTVIQGHTGFVESTSRSWKDDKVNESIELIQNATSQAVGLVKQLLLFSRDQKPSFETLDLNSEVSNFAKMTRRMVEEPIGIRLELDPKAGNIRADKGMLSQMLMNLVVNSRDAMPKGGEIIISTNRMKDSSPAIPGDEISLKIRDTGCGIPPEKLDRVFDPFYTSKPQGTGLGLANVSALVREHRGEIQIESKVGKGTEVEILFPASCESISAPKVRSSSIREEEKSIKGSRVLLVEDESAVRKLVRKLLEMHGCTVVEASSGRQALELWPKVCDDISVVVSDVVMPEGVSGWDLARQLHERNPDLGILLTSGYNEKPEDHGMANKPKIAFLQKPYEAIKLKSNLFDLMNDKAVV